MSDDSKRQIRKESRAQAHKLRNDASWTAPAGRDPMEKLQELDQQARDERVYGEAQECAACVQARAATGDETALCDAHLAEAMGFS